MIDTTIQLNGRTFSVRIEQDDCSDAPWDREDGHGPVSGWHSYETHPAKRPGERVLCADRGTARMYDFAEAVKIARRDGWGLNEKDRAALAKRLGREPKPGDIAHAAAESDFNRLRDWCNDGWRYVGVTVECGDEQESLWGIESDSEDYLEEVARELAEQLDERLPAQRIVITIVGGCVESVYASDSELIVDIIDYDVFDVDGTTDAEAAEQLAAAIKNLHAIY